MCIEEEMTQKRRTEIVELTRNGIGLSEEILEDYFDIKVQSTIWSKLPRSSFLFNPFCASPEIKLFHAICRSVSRLNE
jgi:hypothetical protein